MEHDALLEEVAGAILDGTPVEWAQIESCAAQTDPALIAQLRTLATLRVVSRAAESSESPDHEYWGHLRVLECLPPVLPVFMGVDHLDEHDISPR